MRDDVLGQHLKMFHMVEGRVQQQMLGARFNELRQAIEALMHTPQTATRDAMSAFR
jgi:hypothetical protein